MTNPRALLNNKDTQNGENSTGSSGGQSSTDGNTSSGQTDSSGDGTGNTDTSGGYDSSDTAMTCTFSIECSTILNNWDDLKESKAEFVPADGWILYLRRWSSMRGRRYLMC